MLVFGFLLTLLFTISSLNLPTGISLSNDTTVPNFSQLSLASGYQAAGCGMIPVTQITSIHDTESDSSNEQKQVAFLAHDIRDPNNTNIVVHFNQVADESCDCQLVFEGEPVSATDFGSVFVSVFNLDEDSPRYRASWSNMADLGSCLGTWQICANGTIEGDSHVNTIPCRPNLCFLLAVEQDQVTPGIDISELIRDYLWVKYTCDKGHNGTVMSQETARFKF